MGRRGHCSGRTGDGTWAKEPWGTVVTVHTCGRGSYVPAKTTPRCAAGRKGHWREDPAVPHREGQVRAAGGQRAREEEENLPLDRSRDLFLLLVKSSILVSRQPCDGSHLPDTLSGPVSRPGPEAGRGGARGPDPTGSRPLTETCSRGRGREERGTDLHRTQPAKERRQAALKGL